MGCSSVLVRSVATAAVTAVLAAAGDARIVPHARAAEAAGPLDFNRDIRPILSENCFYCHGQDAAKRQADLRLDVREAALEARAIVPGEPGASTLLERIHSTDPDVRMPPPTSNRVLSDEQRALLDRWIREGAEYRPHWAFIAPTRPTPPSFGSCSRR